MSFTISGVSGGQFEEVTNPGSGVTSFTQLQVTNGDIQFVHDGGEAAPSYFVSVSDGALSDGPYAATVAFSNVNDASLLDLDADDSSAAGIDFSATWTEGAGPALVADSDASLVDIDSASLASLTVTLTNALDGTAEILSADTTGTLISASYDTGTGILTLSGSDSVANYEAVLRTVTYDNASSDPDTTSRVVTFRASDGVDSSIVATTTVSITASNDAPAISDAGLPGPLEFTEQTSVAISSLFTVSDADSAVLTGATLIIAGNYESGSDLLGFTDQLGISGVWDGASGTLSLTGAASIADYQTAIRSVAFNNTSDDPSVLQRSIDIVLSDGTDPSNMLTRLVNINSVNDGPTALIDGAVALEGNTVTIDLAANDSDPDNGLDLASIQIVSGPANGSLILNGDGTVDYSHDGSETLADTFTYNIKDFAGATSNTVTVSLTITAQNDSPVLVNNALTIGEGGTVVLTAANLSASDAETAANALGFTVTGVTGGQFEEVTNPGVAISGFTQLQLTNGEIQFVHDGLESAPTYIVAVSDGALTDGPLAATISFTNVNDAPTIDLDADNSVASGTGFDGMFVSNGGPIAIVDSDASIEDIDSPNLVSLTVTITNAMDIGSEILQADTTGTLIAASFDAATGILTLSGTDSVANYEQVLRTITYDNTTVVPDATTRMVAFVADDGLEISNVAMSNVSVTPVNVVPTANADGAIVDEGAAIVIDLVSNDVDPDDGFDLTSIQIVGGPSNGSVVVGTDGTVTYTHDGSETTSDSFTYTIRDLSGALSNVEAVTITVSAINDAPIATGESFGLLEDTTVTRTAATGVLANDFDTEGDSLASTLVSGPTNAASFVLNADGSFNYVPQSNFFGTDQFSYVVGDATTSSGVCVVTLTVLPENDAPVLSANLGSSATVGMSDTIGASELSASDVDDTAMDLNFALSATPTNGHLELTTNVGVAVSAFSQDDIDAGRLVYVIDDGTATSDAFSFTVADSNGAVMGSSTFSIAINSVVVPPIAPPVSPPVDPPPVDPPTVDPPTEPEPEPPTVDPGTPPVVDPPPPIDPRVLVEVRTELRFDGDIATIFSPNSVDEVGGPFFGKRTASGNRRSRLGTLQTGNFDVLAHPRSDHPRGRGPIARGGHG